MKIQAPLPRILVYQSEDCSILVDYLAFCGFDVISTSEKDVKKKLREYNYDICILDHCKANIPGDLDLLHFLRKIDAKMPVIIVSNLFDYSYITEALNCGADDYVVKPYNIDELICRIKALLRRCGVKVRSIEQSYRIGNYVLDTELHVLKIDKMEIKLTAKESAILALLCSYKGELLSKEILLNSLWNNNNYFVKRSLDVHVCNLRKYLKRDSRIKINTVRGTGYTLIIEGENE